MNIVTRALETKFMKGLKKVLARIMQRILRKGGTTPALTEREDSLLVKIVSNMVRGIRTNSARSWKKNMKLSNELYNAISKEMKGPVGERVAELIAENVKYIRTVPREWAEYITKYAYEEARKGKRPEQIEEELRKVMPERMTKNIKCIARTECAKAQAAITQARAESVGIKAYIWRAAMDERTRHSHAGMNGIMVFYNDPPSPEALFPYKGHGAYGNYHAGNTFNCRCYQEPVVDINFLPDSIKVHSHGSIKTMTKAQIKKQFGQIS